MLERARNGKLAVLSIFGVNPARNALRCRLAVREALERVPFLVVSELFMTETAQRATLVLPAEGAFEKSGTTSNLGGDCCRSTPRSPRPIRCARISRCLARWPSSSTSRCRAAAEIERAVIAAAAKDAQRLHVRRRTLCIARYDPRFRSRRRAANSFRRRNVAARSDARRR